MLLQVLGLDLLKSGLYSVLPWITMAICSNAAGLLADTLIQRGMPVTRVRKGMQTASSWLCCRLRGSALCLGCILSEEPAAALDWFTALWVRACLRPARRQW